MHCTLIMRTNSLSYGRANSTVGDPALLGKRPIKMTFQDKYGKWL